VACPGAHRFLQFPLGVRTFGHAEPTRILTVLPRSGGQRAACEDSVDLIPTGWLLSNPSGVGSVDHAGSFLWAGAVLLIDARGRRKRPRTFLERLHPYQSKSIADQAESWLREQ
jgi:hypothetical protein